MVFKMKIILQTLSVIVIWGGKLKLAIETAIVMLLNRRLEYTYKNAFLLKAYTLI